MLPPGPPSKFKTASECCGRIVFNSITDVTIPNPKPHPLVWRFGSTENKMQKRGGWARETRRFAKGLHVQIYSELLQILLRVKINQNSDFNSN
jgi:hypothetical protein